MSKKDDMMEPTFVYRDGMLADKEYVEWLKELKARYRQSQLRAAVKANNEVLEYYWSLGRDIVAKKAESKWGSGFFNQLSLDMRTIFPNEKGFSVTNLKYMKRWYLFYYERIVNHQQAVDQLEGENRQLSADEIGHQAGDEIEAVIRQQVAAEKSQRVVDRIEGVGKGQQVVDQLEMPELLADCLRISILILFLYERQ